MALLPNGYTQCRWVGGVYDTGVYPSNTLTIDALVEKSALSQTGFVFGARNTNSTTSAGQTNLNIAATTYFGYASARVSMGTHLVSETKMHIHVDRNVLEVGTSTQIFTGTGATTSFTGTRTMYISALNNAGAIYQPIGIAIYGFIIYENGVKTKEFVPCYDETNSEYGLYDLVGGTFVHALQNPIGSTYDVSIQSSQGGGGYIKTEFGNVLSENMGGGIVKAVADNGYVFKEWQDGNGNVISTEDTFDFDPTADTILVPIFDKITDVQLKMHYVARVLERPTSTGLPIELKVISASINEDGLQRATSTIEVDEIPSTVGEGQAIFLYSPKNKPTYAGVIESIEGNVLNCREPSSFFDRDYLFKSGILDETNYNVIYGLYQLMQKGQTARNFIDTDQLLSDWLTSQTYFAIWSARNWHYDLYVKNEDNANVVFPTISGVEGKNLEDLIFESCGFGIFIRAWKGISLFDGHEVMYLLPYFYKNNDMITLSDNLENIKDVEIVNESQEDTVLVVYNEAGTTLRGMYGVTTDGQIGEYSSGVSDQFIGEDEYKGSLILSNDNINTIIAGNLSNANLNHKINFTIDFNGQITFDMVGVGVPVEFYVGSKLFKSVITAISYEIAPNVEEVQQARITLGNVRTNLTSKLNMGR